MSVSRSSVIIIGAGISGISAAKVLAENGVEDLVILEATDRIGGRIKKREFGGVSVELGAGWIAGVGGKESNPVWDLANEVGLRTRFSDYSNARYNICDRSGKIFPSRLAADSYQKAVEEATEKLRTQEANLSDVNFHCIEEPCGQKTPIELAIDFMLHDFEMAEVEPLSTYVDFGEREFLVADERGYEYLPHKMAETFLFSSNGNIRDSRLKLNKVVRELHHSKSGVIVKTEDGFVYEANYVILSVSIGVLQSNLISTCPPFPKWKTEAINACDVIVYTKIFLQFPSKFWSSDSDKEFFVYAHENRGYYTFWQSMESVYPGSNILVVTLTNEESKRVEAQSDEKTMDEAMEVLRDMFGPNIPSANGVLVPRWWDNRFQRGSYSNYPMISDHKSLRQVKAPIGRVFFAGEHTSEKFNGYVHGAYLSGIETGKLLLEEMKNEAFSLLAFTGSLTLTPPETVHNYDLRSLFTTNIGVSGVLL